VTGEGVSKDDIPKKGCRRRKESVSRGGGGEYIGSTNPGTPENYHEIAKSHGVGHSQILGRWFPGENSGGGGGGGGCKTIGSTIENRVQLGEHEGRGHKGAQKKVFQSNRIMDLCGGEKRGGRNGQGGVRNLARQARKP